MKKMSDLDITNHHTICAENELNTVNILFRMERKGYTVSRSGNTVSSETS